MNHHSQHALQWLSTRRHGLLAAPMLPALSMTYVIELWMGSATKIMVFLVLFALTGCMTTSVPGVGQRFRDCAECPEMVVVPSGSFLMGVPESEEGSEDDERPVHAVAVQSFAAGVYEVTFAEWDACVAGGGCVGRQRDEGWGRGRRPVINVSWHHAQLYVQWLSGRTGRRYRLLSESEWEYVARAGTTGPFHTGGTISPDQANYDGRCYYPPSGDYVWWRQTVPVGSFPPNAFGLYDVHGNVWEWVQDCWNGSYQGAPSDGGAWESGNCAYRVLRGGSWINRPWLIRSANRHWDVDFSGFNSVLVGFRVARTLAP